jgi:hypothetical protein
MIIFSTVSEIVGWVVPLVMILQSASVFRIHSTVMWTMIVIFAGRTMPYIDDLNSLLYGSIASLLVVWFFLPTNVMLIHDDSHDPDLAPKSDNNGVADHGKTSERGKDALK